MMTTTTRLDVFIKNMDDRKHLFLFIIIIIIILVVVVIIIIIIIIVVTIIITIFIVSIIIIIIIIVIIVVIIVVIFTCGCSVTFKHDEITSSGFQFPCKKCTVTLFLMNEVKNWNFC